MLHNKRKHIHINHIKPTVLSHLFFIVLLYNKKPYEAFFIYSVRFSFYIIYLLLYEYSIYELVPVELSVESDSVAASDADAPGICPSVGASIPCGICPSVGISPENPAADPS